MKKTAIIKAWGRILTGHYPALTIEITRECQTIENGLADSAAGKVKSVEEVRQQYGLQP